MPNYCTFGVTQGQLVILFRNCNHKAPRSLRRSWGFFWDDPATRRMLPVRRLLARFTARNASYETISDLPPESPALDLFGNFDLEPPP